MERSAEAPRNQGEVIEWGNVTAKERTVREIMAAFDELPPLLRFVIRNINVNLDITNLNQNMKECPPDKMPAMTSLLALLVLQTDHAYAIATAPAVWGPDYPVRGKRDGKTMGIRSGNVRGQVPRGQTRRQRASLATLRAWRR